MQHFYVLLLLSGSEPLLNNKEGFDYGKSGFQICANSVALARMALKVGV